MIEFLGETMAFKVVEDTMICINDASRPAAEEWDAHVRAMGELNRRYGSGMRNLVFTDGGAPNRTQSAALNEPMKDLDFPVAIVMDNAAIRMVIAVLSVWKWQVKPFSPTEVAGAMNHLKIERAHQIVVLRELRALHAKFKPNACVESFLKSAAKAGLVAGSGPRSVSAPPP